MLYGGFDHTIDKKGRIFIPSKFREDLGESFIISRSTMGKECLCIYPFSQWEKLVEKLSAIPDSKGGDFKRYIFDGTFNVEYDTQGRIVIPPMLRSFAQLGASAHLIGMDSHIELWSAEKWTDKSEYTREQVALDAELFGL